MAALPAIAAVLAVGGQVLQTFSQVNQAKAQASAAKSQALAAELEAKSIRESAAFEEQQSRRQANLIIGKQRAVGAASGVDISVGSPLFAELDSIKQAELEALNIRHQGALGATGKAYEAKLARFQGRRYRASIPGIIAGGVAQSGSILSGWMGARSGSPSSSSSLSSVNWSAGRPAPWR